MYAMDTAVHFEHRTESRRDRADRRRGRIPATASAPSTPASSIGPSAPPTAPVRAADDFAD